MPRPLNCRRIGHIPCAVRFKPAGIQCAQVETVVMSLDELEAIRLTDLEGLYQEAAAERMGVSRPTLGRILESAHSKVARVLVHGLELSIEGGSVTSEDTTDKECPRCIRMQGNGRRCPRCRREEP